MSLYLYTGTYTHEGRKGLIAEGGSAREIEVRKLFNTLGGSVERYAFAVGPFDFIILAEMPDDVSALVPSLLAGSNGTVSVSTTKLLLPAEIDQAVTVAKKFGFRKAGG